MKPMGIKLKNLKKPKKPNFKSITANKTDPTVGASTCASGNQIWNGNIGTLDANDKKKANQSQYCSSKVNWCVNKYSRFKVPTIE